MQVKLKEFLDRLSSKDRTEEQVYLTIIKTQNHSVIAETELVIRHNIVTGAVKHYNYVLLGLAHEFGEIKIID